MQSSAQIVPIRARESHCSECAFRGECLARLEGDCPAAASLEIPVAPRILHRGDHLFRTAEEFQNIYMVRSGAIKTYVILQGGEEQVIGFHTPGDIVALDAIESGRYVCNAMVLDTSCVCPLPYDALCRLSARSPETQRRLIEKMSRKIVDHEGLLLILGQKTAEQRTAAFLLHHSNKQRQLGLSEVDINLPMSRADIASYLALAVETVSRVLTRLQESGLLNVQRSRVQLLDLDNLAIIAEETMEASFPARRRASSLH
jgi:CRP/FNR family transcriptional regulator